MREIELILILCQYYFDGEKNIEKFTDKFNQYFKKDASAQTILFSISKFKSVDPANNVDVKDDEYSRLWREYITNEKVGELKELYRCFKKGTYVAPVKALEETSPVQKVLKRTRVVSVGDMPQARPKDYATKGIEAYRRNRDVVAGALAAAEYKCELDCTTELFVRKSSNITYTEAHHLIPLCFQDEFVHSLDVEANVVSLCPNCHCKLHYGADIEPLLRTLYSLRRERLKKCGIEISYEKLLLLYR